MSYFPLGTNVSQPARDLKDNGFVGLLRSWNTICDHRKAMIEAKDSATNTAADYVTDANVWQFLDAPGGVPNSAKAKAGFEEIDTLFAVCDAAIRQACARFK